MELFDNEYFYVNKVALRFTGQWPFETNRTKRYAVRILVLIGLLFLTIPQVLGLIKYSYNIDRVLEHIAILLFMGLSITKELAALLAEDKLGVLYTAISENWKMVTEENEKKILIKHAKMGKLLTLVFYIYAVFATSAFFSLALIPILMNTFIPLNESRPLIIPLSSEFIIFDSLKYYGYVFVFEAVFGTLMVVVLVTFDTMYTACLEQSVALYDIIQYRLAKSNEYICNLYTGLQQEEAIIKWTTEIIQLHQKVLTFSDILRNSYNFPFLIMMILILLYLSILSVLILINLNNNLSNTIRYTGLMFGLLIDYFSLSWPGQKLINSSGGLFNDAYMNEWYKGSTKSNRLLQILMIRVLQPCTISAGGLYDLNFENFMSVIKTSASYITVIGSFR